MVHLSLVPQQNSAILALQLPSQDSVQVQKAWLRMHLAATQLQEAHWSLEAPKVWDRLSKSSFKELTPKVKQGDMLIFWFFSGAE